MSQKGDVLRIDTNGGCSPLSAVVYGTSALVDSKDCGRIQDDGVTFWVTLARATVTWDGPRLVVVGAFHDVVSDAAVDGGTCTTGLEATLSKQWAASGPGP